MGYTQLRLNKGLEDSRLSRATTLGISSKMTTTLAQISIQSLMRHTAKSQSQFKVETPYFTSSKSCQVFLH